MEKKDKKKKAVVGKGKGAGIGVGGKGGAKRNRGGPRGNFRGVQGRAVATAKINNGMLKKGRLQRSQLNTVRAGFITKRFKNKKNNAKNNNGASGSGLVRARSNIALNRIKNHANINNGRGAFNARRGNAAKFGITRSKSRTNLVTPATMKRFFTSNKGVLKRTNSMPNLRDPTSVHNRLGYQSPAQVAYRNRVKRAKQLLLQRQSQRMHQAPNDYRVN